MVPPLYGWSEPQKVQGIPVQCWHHLMASGHSKYWPIVVQFWFVIGSPTHLKQASWMKPTISVWLNLWWLSGSDFSSASYTKGVWDLVTCICLASPYISLHFIAFSQNGCNCVLLKLALYLRGKTRISSRLLKSVYATVERPCSSRWRGSNSHFFSSTI